MHVDRMLVARNAAGTSARADWLRALELSKSVGRQPYRTLPNIIEELAQSTPDAPALLSDRESFTFAALAERANRYARWALANGVEKQDVICLLMPNCPEYMAIWLGITRVGGTVALLNTSLVGASLAQCVDIVRARHMIVADELMPAFADARRHLTTAPRLWVHGGGARQDRQISNARSMSCRASGCLLPGVARHRCLIAPS
jgi:fatty-acyl-CoA synthase